MKPLDRIGDHERAVINERTDTGYGQPLERFADHEPVLRALLERLLPGVPANIDLAAFVDSHPGQPMGRGDRRDGLPPVPELFAAGLAALANSGFVGQSDDDQRALISRIRPGEADDELGMPAKDFVDRLLYAWIGPAEVIARHDKKPGWERL